MIRLCGLTWYDFVELVDIERSGGSGVAWLSRTNSISHEAKHDRASSIETDSTAIYWSDEEGFDEANDKIITKPAITKLRRTRLKRAQSERVPSLEGTPPPLPPRGVQKATAAPATTQDKSSESSTPTRGTPKLNRSRPVRGPLVKSMTFTAKDMPDHGSRFRTENPLTRNEEKRREAVWDLFQSETAFLLDHLMVMKHVSNFGHEGSKNDPTTVFSHLQVFLEPLKKAQVEGFLMFAEPEVLFGNLDELCSVRFLSSN